MKKIFNIIIITLFLSLLFPIAVFASDNVAIGINNVNSGIVTVQYKADLVKTIKVRITKGSTNYDYTIENNQVNNLPLQMGDGAYKVIVLENVSGNKYRIIASEEFNAKGLKDSDVYTNSIINVNFDSSMKSIKELKKIIAGAATDKEKVELIHEYIVDNIDYDNNKADKIRTSTETYIPVIDKTYISNKGICYDYASLFASILREVGIPTKLEMGYAPEIEEYHAWNSVYLDGKWVTMDSTYDAQAKEYKIEFQPYKESKNFNVVKQF